MLFIVWVAVMLAGSAVLRVLKALIDHTLENRRNSFVPDPDPLLELAEAHKMELACWDEQFRQVTGKLVDPPRVIQGSYSELLAPGLTPKQVFDQQHQQNMQRMLEMAQQSQQLVNNPYAAGSNPLTGLLGGLGNIFGGIH